jgi:hypothetical protein
MFVRQTLPSLQPRWISRPPGAFSLIGLLMLGLVQIIVSLATVPGQRMKELHHWVLMSVVGVHWPLNGLSRFLPPPPLVALV